MSYQSDALLTVNEHHLMRHVLNILTNSFSTIYYQISIYLCFYQY